MEFQLTEEQEQLREAARRYVRDKLPPVAEELEKTNQALPRELLRDFARMGFLGINVPEQLGGLGLGNLEALIVLEEFAQISSAVAFPVFESIVGPVRAIERFGDPKLANEVVPAVCRGEKIVAVSMSEPQAGTALTDLKTRAEVQGDTVVVNGTKRWCSGGGHADGYVVYCRMSDDPGARGIGAVYVEKDTPGLSFGAPENLMGFRGIPSSDVYLDNVTVPSHHVIVPAGGFRKLMEAFDLERCGNATMALGQASGALEDVVAYVQEREQFGKPIVEFQAVLPSMLDSSVAKCFANEIARTVTGNALQLMGGYGYSKEYSVERRMRDAWGWGIAGGAIDIQKVNIAAAMVGRRFDQRK